MKLNETIENISIFCGLVTHIHERISGILVPKLAANTRKTRPIMEAYKLKNVITGCSEFWQTL